MYVLSANEHNSSVMMLKKLVNRNKKFLWCISHWPLV